MSLTTDIPLAMRDGSSAPLEATTIELSSVDRCILCGSSENMVVLSGPDRMHHVPGEFTLVQCHVCRLVYQAPRPAQHTIDRLYPPSYEPFQALVAGDGDILSDIQRTATFVNALLPRGGTLLDVGCGVGDFLVAMRRLFPAWQVSGVEPSSTAAMQAQQRDPAVVHGTLEDIPDSLAPDVVTLWNVLEHLPDPLAALRAIEERLAPGGYLCLAVPVHDSWEARLFGKYWVGWELPRHFYIFDHATITRTLQEAGFTIARRACLSGTHYGVIRSVLLALEEWVASYAVRRLCGLVITSRLMKALLQPYMWLAERCLRGTVLTLAARRTRDLPA